MSTTTNRNAYLITPRQAALLAQSWILTRRFRPTGEREGIRYTRAVSAFDASVRMVAATYGVDGWGSYMGVREAIERAYDNARATTEPGHDTDMDTFAAAILTNVNALT